MKKLYVIILLSMIPVIALPMQNPQEDTPLIKSLYAHNIPEAIRLINEGADVNVRDTQLREPALVLAIELGDIQLIKLLLAHGANPNLPGGTTAGTPLMYAVASVIDQENPDLTVIKLLIDHGANPELKNRAGKSAVSIARAHGKTKLADFMRSYAYKLI